MKKLIYCFLGVFSFFGVWTSAGEGQPNNNESDKLVAQGEIFEQSGKISDALRVYAQAAKTGNANAAFDAGELLFKQGRAKTGREGLLDLSAGLGYLFIAATNHQPQACARLAEAFQNGIVVQTNLVCAYAWLEVAAHSASAFSADMDRLVVQLEPAEILQAQTLGREYITGRWPAQIVPPLDQGDSRLQIQGVSYYAQGALIILNGDTLAVGESINVLPAGKLAGKSKQKLTVSCRKIGADYALVAVAGETNLKLLPIEKH